MPTTVVVALEGLCAGQNHAHLSVTENGGPVRQFTFEAEDLMIALNPITLDQAHDALSVILRYHFKGRTKLQIRNELQAGIELVI